MPIGVPKVLFRVPGAPQADWVDIYNRLYRERIIFLGQEIDDEIANQIIAVMLYLESEDNTKPIYLYINSPGGSVIAGMAIYDTMKHIKSEVVTINVGLAASMASFLLGGGEKGKRLALPHSRVMIHQPMVRDAAIPALCEERALIVVALTRTDFGFAYMNNWDFSGRSTRPGVRYPSGSAANPANSRKSYTRVCENDRTKV